MMSASRGEGEEKNEDGVVSGHAYSLLAILEFKHDGQDVRLLRLRNPWGKGEWTGDWSDGSSKWTPELRQRYKVVDADDGTFCIPYADYMENFACTTFCMEYASRYSHSNIHHSFGPADDSHPQQAFFSFTLTKEIDFMESVFGISVLQQGNRLGNYRKTVDSEKFKPTQFNIVLMTKGGKFVKARFGSRFMFSLENTDLVLPPGAYVMMIDPIWDPTANNDGAYRDVLVDIYGPESPPIMPVDESYGKKLLAKALKHAAMTKTPDSAKKKYLADKTDYKDCIRVQEIDAIDCWYGFIYT